MEFESIGVIKTNFEEKVGVPIQSVFAKDEQGKVEIFDMFLDGLLHLEEFSHVHLIYNFHKLHDYKLHVRPYLDNIEHGVFATRAPKRPNRVGLSLVELVSIDGNIITFKGADMLNNTPLIDIKPFVGDFDNRKKFRCGWYDEVSKSNTVSDNRF